MTSGDNTYILVTGANSGLGLATLKRLIDQFAVSRSAAQTLTLIFTTRDAKKASETRNVLDKYISRRYPERASSATILLQPERVDLTSLASVHELAHRLIKKLPFLDVAILNAGTAGQVRVNWPLATWRVLTQLKTAVLYPDYTLTTTGLCAPIQQQLVKEGSEKPSERHNDTNRLGLVFTANLFGHYVLARLLMPLFAASPDDGRIIFISSTEAFPTTLSLDDLQGLKTDKTYGSSKRITDILVLTSSSTSVSPYSKTFFTDHLPWESDTRRSEAERRPSLLLAHPGICATSFVPLPIVMRYGMLLLFFIARIFLGSPWHNIDAYKGASAPVWLALVAREELDKIEEDEGKAKWGSSCNWRGQEAVVRTGVAGWGVGGGKRPEADENVPSAQGPGAVGILNEQVREDFMQLGRDCWQRMEDLARYWEEQIS